MADLPSTPDLIAEAMRCSVPGCAKERKARGWCGMHYERWRTHGDPNVTLSTHEARFQRAYESAAVIEDGCLVYGEGPIWRYRRIRVHGVSVGAHRISYEIHNGEIPEGLVIDHLCRVPACVNPDHLEAVTDAENILRGTSFAAHNRRKRHCHNGHPLSGDNMYVDRAGARVCRECKVERTRQWRARQ